MSALLEYECRKRGARCLAYPPVVANGIMNNTLHYIYNDNALRHAAKLRFVSAYFQLHSNNFHLFLFSLSLRLLLSAGSPGNLMLVDAGAEYQAYNSGSSLSVCAYAHSPTPTIYA
jgi:Xaa-Pro aminopeptidase